MDWFFLTLASAFSLATADTLTKRYLSHFRPGELVLVRFGVSGLMLLPLVLMQPWPYPETAFWYWMGGILPLELTAMWLYMKAISESPLSLTLPYLAFTPVFNTVTGYVMLGETVTAEGFAGILLVVFGAWILNLEAARDNGRLDIMAPFRAITREAGSRHMLAVAAIYSLTSVMGKGALQYVEPGFLGPFYFVATGVAAVLVFGLRKETRVKPLARHPWACIGVGVFMTGMVVTHFYALVHIEVAYMLAVKRTSLLFGMLYGAWLFHETGLKKNLAAGMMMVLGVYLIVA